MKLSEFDLMATEKISFSEDGPLPLCRISASSGKTTFIVQQMKLPNPEAPDKGSSLNSFL